jgi:hypothetical protein
MKVCGKEICIAGRLLRVAHLEGDGFHFLESPEPVIDGLRKYEVRIDLFTFMQKVSDTAPKYTFPMEWDNFAAVPVSTFEHWWTKQVDNKTRNMARKAEKKGVTVREIPFDDNLIQGIWEIYNECPVRQGRRFTHYGKDIETVRKETSTFLDTSVFIGAFDAGKMIGFVKLTSDETRTQAALMNIVSMIRSRDKAPTNALIVQSVRSCADRNIPYLVYSKFSYGNRQRDSVSDFKERNGFQRIDVPRYYIPFTTFGQAAYRLGLHKRFVDHLPEPVLARIRNLRNVWNTQVALPLVLSRHR